MRTAHAMFGRLHFLNEPRATAYSGCYLLQVAISSASDSHIMSRRSERVKRLQEKATTTITSQAADTEKARNTNIAGSDNGTPLVSANSDNVQEIPIKKVARRNAARGSSRRAGKLRQMLDMPLDVVLEVRHLLRFRLKHSTQC